MDGERKNRAGHCAVSMMIPSKTIVNGFSMPVLGLGTWTMGGRMNRDPDNDDEADIAAIRRAVDAGIMHIDTAEMYAAGHAEEMIASATVGVPRADLFVVSKVSPEHLAYDDVLHAIEGSLSRLQTDYLDLYLIHKPNPAIPMEGTLKALTRLVDQGMVRHIGVSNFTAERWSAAQELTPHPLVINQVHYSLQCREPEHTGLLDYCISNGRLLTAWRPVMNLRNHPEDSLLQQIAHKYGKTSTQIAINWLISQKNIVTLVKMRSQEHREENLGAVGWEMEADDIELLRRGYPDQMEVSDAVPLH